MRAYKRLGRTVSAFVIAGALPIAGCGGPVLPPEVDMVGVDQAQYQKDLQACYRDMPGFAWGNPITKCMKEKGYKILVSY